MPYFTVFQSVNKDGPYKWYWSLHEESGHMYHISDGYYQYQTCIDELAANGLVFMKQYADSQH